MGVGGRGMSFGKKEGEERSHREAPSYPGRLPAPPGPSPCQLLPCTATVLGSRVQLEVCRRGEGPTVQNVHLIKVENMV